MKKGSKTLHAIPGLTLSALLLAAGGSTAAPARAESSIVPGNTMPGPLKAVHYDQRLGEQVPLDLPFRDDAGRPVKLGDYFGARPALLILAYYRCPMLCDMVMQAAESGLKPVSLTPGKDFEVIVASIDPTDTPERAAMKKRDILKRYARPGTEAGWHFLSGPKGSIDPLARAVGFQYVYDPKLDQFAHAAGIVLLTPEGKVSRYFFGIEYPPRDLRLGLIEASGNKIGSLVDQVLLYCFHYDPVIGRYSVITLRLVRVAGLATVIGLVLLVVILRRRETAQPRPLGAA
ncbi:MAG TPA: SCO family protein [Thermoanaerobaculia bacterium]|jgi:protein SCO1/2|nr:SCO family protein [Thermoanaerobaculia bacterium]